MNHEYNTPQDLELERDRAQEAAFEKAVPTGVLAGNWANVNPGTRGIVKVSIATTIPGPVTTVHLWGACHPTPCDWKAVKAIAYSAAVDSNRAVAFSAQYAFSFKDVIVVGHLEGQLLVIETYDRFKDGSGRFDYYDRETFHRVREG